jgi:hypothetical protein
LKVALDEGVPEDVIGHPRGHDMWSVRMLGLKGVKNGKLLAAVTEGRFEAFITNDKQLEAQGQLSQRPFAILVLSATNWNVIEPHVAKIAKALEVAAPGSIQKIDCGRFIPAKFRKRDFER